MDAHPSRRYPDPSYCSFCNITGHTLEQGFTASRILRASHESSSSARGSSRGYSSKSSGSRSANKSIKANKVETAPLESEEEDTDYDVAEITLAKTAFCARSFTPNTDLAIIDSGCSESMTPCESHLRDVVASNTRVLLADNSVLHAVKKGILALPTPSGRLHHSMLVPKLSEPLLSISSLCDDGFEVVFDKTSFRLFRLGSTVVTSPPIAVGERKGSLYYLPLSNPEVHCLSSSCSPVSTPVERNLTYASLLDWHALLGHVGL